MQFFKQTVFYIEFLGYQRKATYAIYLYNKNVTVLG